MDREKSLEAIARHLPRGVDIDDCEVVTGGDAAAIHRDAVVAATVPGYYAADEDRLRARYYELADTAAEAAHDYVEGSHYEPDNVVSILVWRVTIFTDKVGDVYSTRRETWERVVVPSEEPDCAERDRDHDWRSPAWLGGCAESPGVQGHGGGVVVREVCAHCGAYRITDTWADDGHGGHCTQVWYADADDDSLAWVTP